MPLPSSAAKSNVTPIARLEKKAKAAKGLKRSQMERKPSKLKQTPLGHCTPVQRARVKEHACIVCRSHFGECDPAHLIPRGHPKMTPDAAEHPLAVIPLCRECHRAFDDGMDILSYLEPDWRESQAWAAGAVGLATAMRSITGEAHLRVVSGDGERG